MVGESSGDALAAGLVRELKRAHPEDLECLGVGGPSMKAAGFNILLPFDQISVIGIWEVIPKIPRIIKIFKALTEEILKQNPDGIVTVDFPDFNFHLGKTLRKRGYKGKIIHYVAPSVWAWRKGRAKKIASFLDGIICLFPMEPAYFKEHKLKAAFVGHPIVESRVDKAEGGVFREANEIPEDSKTLGLFFGSRETEFKGISSVLKQSALLANEAVENLRIIAPTLPATEYNIQVLLKGFELPIHVTSNQRFKWESFKACEVALAVSGTVALELAYAGVPHAIVYRTNPITYMFLRFMVKVKHIHLANILLNESVVPEFIQGKCDPEVIAETLITLFTDKETREKQISKFKEVRKMIGFGDEKLPSQKAAEFVLDIMKDQPRKIVREETPSQKPAASEQKPDNKPDA